MNRGDRRDQRPRRAREVDQLAGDDAQRAGRRLGAGGQLGGEHRLTVERERPLLAAAPPRQERAQREPLQPLVPAHPIVVGVAVGEVATVGAAHDAELLAQREERLRIDVGKTAGDRRVHRELQQLGAAERPGRQGEQQLDRRQDVALGGRRQVEHGVGQLGRGREHLAGERQVRRRRRRGNHDREVVEAQRVVAPHQRPDLGGDGLQLAARIGRAEHHQALVARRGARGCAARAPGPPAAAWPARWATPCRRPDPRSARESCSRTARCRGECCRARAGPTAPAVDSRRRRPRPPRPPRRRRPSASASWRDDARRLGLDRRTGCTSSHSSRQGFSV